MKIRVILCKRRLEKHLIFEKWHDFEKWKNGLFGAGFKGAKNIQESESTILFQLFYIKNGLKST